MAHSPDRPYAKRLQIELETGRPVKPFVGLGSCYEAEMTPAETRPPGPSRLQIPRAEELRTPNPLARLAAERWRLRRSGASREALARLGEKYRALTRSGPTSSDNRIAPARLPSRPACLTPVYWK